MTFLGPVTLPSDLRSYPPMALIPTSSLPIPFLMLLTTSTSPSLHLPSGCTPLTPYPPVLATHPPGWTPRMASSSLGSDSRKEDLDESSWSPWLPLWRGGTGGSRGGLWVEEWVLSAPATWQPPHGPACPPGRWGGNLLEEGPMESKVVNLSIYLTFNFNLKINLNAINLFSQMF